MASQSQSQWLRSSGPAEWLRSSMVESFFYFFNPLQVPEDDDDLDEDTVSCNHHLSMPGREKKSFMMDEIMQSVCMLAQDQYGNYVVQAIALISRLTEEKNAATQQNSKLRQELELLRKEVGKQNGGFSFMLVVIVAILGILLGYLIKA